MGEKLNEVLVDIPLAPHGEIVAVSKWDRVGPELLAALEDGLQWIETGRVDGVAYDEQSVAASFSAAIAKAKGE